MLTVYLLKNTNYSTFYFVTLINETYLEHIDLTVLRVPVLSLFTNIYLTLSSYRMKIFECIGISVNLTPGPIDFISACRPGGSSTPSQNSEMKFFSSHRLRAVFSYAVIWTPVIPRGTARGQIEPSSNAVAFLQSSTPHSYLDFLE
jgi:hypothetical protein